MSNKYLYIIVLKIVYLIVFTIQNQQVNAQKKARLKCVSLYNSAYSL